MKNRFLPSFFFAGIFFVGLMSSCKRPDRSSVELYLKGSQGRKLAFYEITVQEGAVFLDSLSANTHGRIRILLPENGNGMYTLHAENGNGFVLLPEKEKRIVITADFDSLLETVSVSCMESDRKERTGNCDRKLSQSSRECPTAIAVDYQKHLAQTEKQIEEINRNWMENRYRISQPDSLHEACIRQVDSLLARTKSIAEDICRKNTSSLLPVLITNKQLAGRNLFDLENSRDLAFLLSCARKMKQSQEGNPHAERFLFNLERMDNFRKQQQIDQWAKERERKEEQDTP